MSREVTAGTRSKRDAGKTVRTLAEDGSDLEVKALDTIRAVDSDRWNGVVERSDLGTVFHRYEWLDAIETGLGYPARHLLVEKDTNPIGVFPNFVADLPKTPFSRLTSVYPGFGGPLLTTDVADSLSLVIDAVPDLCSGRTIVHEIRACNTDFLRYNDSLYETGYRSDRMGGRFLLRLPKGYDTLLSEMDGSKRRAIRRGRETDHRIVEADVTRESLERFHTTYERHMQRTGGDALPFAFFEQLLEMRSRVLLVTLRIDGEYAGGYLDLLNDEQSTVHGFFAGVPEEYFEYYASELLYDYLIQWAIENGYETYDFGGSGADFEDGSFRFKEGFGGTLVPNLYWERGLSPAWKLVETGRSLYWRYAD
ncbi:GNAT family N-acetyltransferase [Halopiger djelfimassiliensis]|uniref:GNAT family N-acetyltransferase n=1 Tax=Halopiger djelfimassiliensis TaxID=1293047 RepID=UPI0006776D4F|nr:GNAT family N-acetyltransferase [Halopiger djelfimassiliensis]